jgi:hypothetical protein
MEASFLSLEVQGQESVDLSEIISKFSEIYDRHNRPEGDDLDLLIRSMIQEVCDFFKIKYILIGDDVYLFMPLDFELDDDAIDTIIESFASGVDEENTPNPE